MVHEHMSSKSQTLIETAERIIRLLTAVSLGKNDMTINDLILKFVPRLELQGTAYGQRNRCLGFGS